jgi:hypothetical protein
VALKAFTVAMDARARSTRVAAVADSVRSEARRGLARDWEVAWTRERRGTAERMTRVRAQERVNARTRQVRDVVRCWRSSPEASDDALRTSSVSLGGEKVNVGELI